MNQITIIVPTYNRPACLRRLLAYFETAGFDGNLVIADSSKDIYKSKNSDTISSININKTYHVGYSTEVALVEKIYRSIRDTDTEYVVLCADDDFITKRGVKRAVAFLDNHPDFVAAHGHYIRFTVDRAMDGVQFNWQPSYLGSQSIDSSRPERRLYKHFANYVPTFYAVHRTAEIKEAYECAVKYADDVRFRELLPSLLTIISGKFKHLDVLYGARYSSEQLGQKADDMHDFIERGTFQSKYERFRQVLSERLATATDLSVVEANGVADRGMTVYLADKYDLSTETARQVVAGVPVETNTETQSGSSESPSPLVVARDWLVTTPFPDRLISVMEFVYRQVMRVPQSPVVTRTSSPDTLGRKWFYFTLDPPLRGCSPELERIAQTVCSHPDALNE